MSARFITAPAPAGIEAISAARPLLQAETRPIPDAIAASDVAASLGPATPVRLDIDPDGGVSRPRLFGRKAP